tara:strand:+ start:1778 stop:2560 length:783 start_codon:yes stop_codon:yes gene_type:complete
MSKAKSIMSTISKELVAAGMLIVLYSVAGRGKTSMCANLSKSVLFGVCDGENSLPLLVKSKQCPPVNCFQPWKSYAEVVEALEALAESDELPEVFVIDSLFYIGNMIKEAVLQELYHGDRQKFKNYGVGAKDCGDEALNFMKRIRAITERGVHVILIAHAESTRYANPEDADYLRMQFSSEKWFYYPVERQADNVFYIGTPTNVDTTGSQAKARGTDERWLYTTGSPSRICKNRLGLDDKYNLGKSAKSGAEVLSKVLGF